MTDKITDILRKPKREPVPEEMKNKVCGDIATLIDKRVSAAIEVLKAKGYDCPKITVGFETMGDYGSIVYARMHLDSPKCWMRQLPYSREPKSIEGLLDEIDASAAEVPTMLSIEQQEDAALAKLTKEERKLLGIDEFAIKMRRA